MTDKKTEALKLALEALEMHCSFVTRDKPNAMDAGIEAIAICKQALAEQFCDNHCTWLDHHPECDKAEQLAQQEPVAWYGVNIAGVKYLGWKYEELDDRGFDVFPLYTSPPASKPWVGLTDEEIAELKNLPGADRERTATEMAFAVQNKLKEKNH